MSASIVGNCRHFTLVILFVIALLGCQTYEPVPLDPDAILAREIARRTVAPEATAVTLSEAVSALRARNPRIRKAWAAYHAAAAVAKTPTPLPNPSLTAGPLFLQGANILGSARYGVEAALGWTIVLSGTRAITDDLHQAKAHAALLDAAGAEREEYLLLRAEMADLSFLSTRLTARREVAAAAAAAVEAGRSLVEAALATALDVRILELETARAESAVIAEEAAVIDARAKLAARVGYGIAAFSSIPPDTLAALPSTAPSLEDLQRSMLAHNPVLNALRAQYVIAEHELKLEVARQYPSLGVGPSYEREEKVDRFGLPFGIDLPIFDRNQQGIARARGARDQIRVQFEAAVAVRLGMIESINERLRLAQRRIEFGRSRIAPLSRETIDLARRGLPAGAVDALRFLEVLRADREVRLDLASAEFEIYRAWTDLEQACGLPLLRFPGEPELAPDSITPHKEDSR